MKKKWNNGAVGSGKIEMGGGEGAVPPIHI